MAAITDRAEIERLVRAEFTTMTKTDCSEIDADMPLAQGLGIDSLFFLELYAMIESSFNVMIPTDRLQSMNSINSIVDTILEFQ